MKRNQLAITVAAGSLLSLSGCGQPDFEEVREIRPSETAFVIALEGDTKANQASFMSEQFLESNKVATKRISIPHRKMDLGHRIFPNYQWIPTVSVITVDRTPVTREWTRSEKTGTSATNQAISVESQESIDFSIGVVMTASIPEQYAARFLYHAAGRPLAAVADENIRGFVQAVLSREFGQRTLDEGRRSKKEIFDIALKETAAHFAVQGISIDNLGYSEGMTYTDPKIQLAINETFEAEMAVNKAREKVLEAQQTRLAAEEFAKAKDASVARTQLDVSLMQAQAELDAAHRWDGHLPASVVPSQSPLLFGLDRPVNR